MKQLLTGLAKSQTSFSHHRTLVRVILYLYIQPAFHTVFDAGGLQQKPEGKLVKSFLMKIKPMCSHLLNSYAEVTPNVTIFRQGLYRVNYGKIRPYGVGPNTVWLVSLREARRTQTEGRRYEDIERRQPSSNQGERPQKKQSGGHLILRLPVPRLWENTFPLSKSLSLQNYIAVLTASTDDNNLICCKLGSGLVRRARKHESLKNSALRCSSLAHWMHF